MAHSVTRPEAMNATPHHPKVNINVKLSDPFFVAGSAITGKMELECRADKGLGLGVIKVELVAIEELTSRDHSATSRFMHAVRLFQGQGIPPSNAVLSHPLPGDPPLPSHYWPARRGQTTFLFRFDLPPRTPGSIDFGRGLARVRYEVRATAGVVWRGERRLVTHAKDANVVEDIEDADLKAEAIVVGEGGKIWVQGRVIGGVLVAGHSACLELQVKNHSTKKNTGLVVTLTRFLHLPNVPAGQKPPLQISDTLTSVDFRSAEYVVAPGVEGVANLVFDVPKHAAGVRGDQRDGADGEGSVSPPLFEVRCIVSCKITMGIGSKDIVVEVLVRIVHPTVAPPPPVPVEYTYEEYAPQAAAIPAVPTGQPIVLDPRAMSPYPYDPRPTSPYPYPNASAVPISPAMSPRPSSPYMYHPPATVIQPYVDANRVWIPPPTHTPMPYQYFSPSASGHPYSPPPPSLAYAPPRPASAHPSMVLQIPSVPSGLPTSAAGQQPLLAALAAVVERPEDEGKGERATRISHHLRTTSRHRSVSPPANRSMEAEPVAIPATSAGPAEALASPTADVGNMSLSPPSHVHPRRLSLDNAPSSSPIISPRPMLSPKASFTREPIGNGSLAKSDRVVALEELAGAADKLHKDMSADLPASALADAAAIVAREKTLPGPPVPSGKPPSAQPSRPRADKLFAPEPEPEGTDKAPPTPTLVAFSPGRYQRASPAMLDVLTPTNGGESGLDALEKRLLAQVGTRKIEKEDTRLDVRELMVSTTTPIAIPPRKSNGLDTPLNDSAISSLTLSNGRSVDDRAEARGLTPNMGLMLGQRLSQENIKIVQSSPSPRASPHPSPPGTPRSPSDVIEKVRSSKESKASSKKQRDPADEEAVQLRKAAKGRVAAWLENISPDVPPQVDSIASSPEPVLPPPVEFATRDDDEDSSSEGAKTNKAKSRTSSPGIPRMRTLDSSEINGMKTARASPTKQHSPLPPSHKPAPPPSTSEVTKEDVNSAPNPRSSGFVPIGSVKQKFTSGATLKTSKSPRLPAFPQPPALSPPEVKYDVRSARGGRGGKVTAVAAIWANQAKGPVEEKKPAPAPAPTLLPAPIFKPSVTRSPSTPSMKQPRLQSEAPKVTPASPSLPKAKDGFKTPTAAPASPVKTPPKWSDVARKAPIPKLARPTPFADAAKAKPAPPITAKPNVAELTTNRARMIKSTSVPAVVSSSLATPMLSSTASLARPSPSPQPAVPLPGLTKARGAGLLSPRTETPPTISHGLPKTGPSLPNNKLREGLRNIAASPTSPVPKPTPAEPSGETAFGQARLRELIKKYQGQK